MDFVFHCQSCSGPLIARIELRGCRFRCPHCSCGTLAPAAPPAVTEAEVSSLLDQPLAGTTRLLRRVRTPEKKTRFTSSRSLPAHARSARVSRDR